MIIPQQVSYCNQKLRIFFCTSIRDYQALTTIENKRNNLNDKTFTFMQILSSHSTRPKIGTLASQPIHPMSQCLPLIIGIGAIQHMLIIHGFSLFIFEWLRLGSKLCPICHKVGLQQTSETHFSCETKFSLGHLKWAWQSNFCDIFHFTLSLIFTRTVTIWPFLGVFCLDPHKNAVWSKQVHIFLQTELSFKKLNFWVS